MKITKAEIIVLDIPMVQSLKVSFWEIKNLKPIIVKLTDELWNIWYGESILLPFPMTHFEYFETGLETLKNFIIPSILEKEIELQENNYFQTLEDFIWCYKSIKNFEMTKTGVENAFIHILSQRMKISIFEMFESKKSIIQTECCFWIPDNLEIYIKQIQQELEKWFDTVKLKICKWKDVELIKLVRKKFPHIKISLDANQDYDLESFKKIVAIIDESAIEMVEQPFQYDDFIANIEIKKIMKTKLCLDESICRIDQLENMISYQWIDILNIKIWRVWGVYSAYKINKLCEKYNIWTWVWWLLETSIWKSFNLAIAAMENCRYTNDISVWDEFYSDYIITEPDFIKNGKIHIDLEAEWLWFEVDGDKLEKYAVEKIIF